MSNWKKLNTESKGLEALGLLYGDTSWKSQNPKGISSKITKKRNPVGVRSTISYNLINDGSKKQNPT